MKLIKKTQVGAKVRNIYGKPLTPYQRLLLDDRVSLGVKKVLRIQHDRIDILALTADLVQALERLALAAAHYPYHPLSRATEPVKKLG